MEATMYEDGAYNNFSRESLSQMKRKLTLDLNSRPPKKQRPGGGNFPGHFNPLLTSPDLNQLKLASPELERLIMQQGTTVLNQNNPATPSQFFFPKAATEEQEEFARGFVDTLEQLHHQGQGATGSSSDGGAPSVVVTTVSEGALPQYTQLGVHQHQPTHHLPKYHSDHLGHDSDSHLGLFSHIKEEPQIVPSMAGSPPMSPIDMDDQERIKLERKRLRNRIAASKCRRRKLERIGKLEDKVRGLKGENTELQNVVNKLRDQVCHLKQEVMEHVNSGCQIPFVTNH
ncbi:unnamed protein product [Meganyctiphanes norvegica]|uniref:BZIP domain-containing protein n=1 Tax=Meganyctiphanes norvegica TaxID=48144 RepID=A0AAV2S479_MEGNR